MPLAGKLLDEDFSVYNKGSLKADGTKQQRYFVRSKAKLGPKKKAKKQSSYDPGHRDISAGITGYFSKREDAVAYIPTFRRMVNGERPKRAAAVNGMKSSSTGTPEQPGRAAAVSALDAMRKQQLGEKQVAMAEEQRSQLFRHLRKKNRCSGPVLEAVSSALAAGLKKNVDMKGLAESVTEFVWMEKEARADQNWRRQEQARTRKRKPRTAYRSYKRKQLKSVLARLGKWEAARKHLAPFVAESTTEGLVMSPDGIDMSVDGDQWVLRKATLVHLYVSSRLLGLSRDIATEITCATFPESERMHSGSTLRRYLAEYFEMTLISWSTTIYM